MFRVYAAHITRQSWRLSYYRRWLSDERGDEVKQDITIPKYRARDNETTEVLRARLLYQSRKRGMLENGLLLRCALITVCNMPEATCAIVINIYYVMTHHPNCMYYPLSEYQLFYTHVQILLVVMYSQRSWCNYSWCKVKSVEALLSLSAVVLNSSDQP